MTDVAPLLERAQLLLAQGRPKDAERQLVDALRIEPENDYALGLLARCKYDQKQIPAGIEAVKSAIRVMPHEGYYYYLLAFGYYQLDQHEPALRYLQRAVELSPWSAEFFGLWGLVLLEEKKFEAALAKANEGLAVDAENITCLNVRSTALNKLRRVEDAMETMKDALEKDPENPWTHTTVGWNLLEKRRHNEAARHFREALRLQPNLEGAREGLKQALKSKIPPYKWLLQYSFWINNKGKRARLFIPIAIYAGVQLLSHLSLEGGGGLAAIGYSLLALYVLFVITSWVINPLANFFLFFYKDGKYALTRREKLNAISLVVALSTGLGLVIASLLMPLVTVQLLVAGLITMSLGLPLGHMHLPLQWKGNSWVQWFSICLVLLGLAVIVLVLATPLPVDKVGFTYLGAFVLYTWASIFRS